MKINNNFSFHIITRSSQNKTKSEKNSLNKVDTISSNKEIKLDRNNFNKNLNNSFNNKSRDKLDFFKKRFNFINNKYKYDAKDNYINNRLNITSLEGFNKINKKNDNHNVLHNCEEQKNKKIRNKKFLIFVTQEQKPLFYHPMYLIIIQKKKDIK